MTYKILTETQDKKKFVSYTLDGITYEMGGVFDNGVLRVMNESEALARAEKEKKWSSESTARKLADIKNIRKQKLEATDYMANSDYTMPDNIKTWRQSLRDIPQNYTKEEQYDLLLARETDKTKDNFGQLTHSIWEKP